MADIYNIELIRAVRAFGNICLDAKSNAPVEERAQCETYLKANFTLRQIMDLLDFMKNNYNVITVEKIRKIKIKVLLLYSIEQP